MLNRTTALSFLLFVFGLSTPAIAASLDDYNVSWDTTGASSVDSMPLGNGDIGLNVWVEKDGDLLFYISKTDAWMEEELVKVGRVRVRFTPNPFTNGAPFRQTLVLRDGAVEIQGGPVTVRVWVDANHPVVRVEASGKEKFDMSAAFDPHRLGSNADTILEGQKDSVVWYWRNGVKSIPRLPNHTFGAILRGEGLASVDRATVKTPAALEKASFSVCVLAAQTATPEQWLAQIQQLAVKSGDGDWAAHCLWWQRFWDRSWLFVSGDDSAQKVTQGYVLQRFVSACGGRGAYPIKFNGSIFTMDWLKKERNKSGGEKETKGFADQRKWGGQYWFQNTRAMYWPMLQSGDFDMMISLFRMYLGQLPGNLTSVRKFYGHDGAYFAETNPFWGSLPNIRPGEAGKYTKHYFTPILELCAMILDAYAYTGDRELVKQYLLPMAEAGLTFFDQHFKHENGKLVLDPANAIEMYWAVRNPAPDIAGLRWVLRGLQDLPKDLTSPAQRERWEKMMATIPALPLGESSNGEQILMPAEVYGKGRNSENPELYAIYPFRLFGLGKPGLEMARATFAVRRFKGDGCWNQSGIQAALLGDVGTAKTNVIHVFTRQDSRCRFAAFWRDGFDYFPDQDNGGNGLNALQLMLMQSEGEVIRLLPAWPEGWNCEFKLNAPYQTTVQGRVEDGKIVDLKVSPKERLKDVVIP